MGRWVNKSKEGLLIENWEKTNDSLYNGESYFVIAGDTLFSEKISLEQKGGDVYYIPVVRNQNNGKAVPFRMTLGDSTQMIFENKEHDFPQKIIYRKISKDSIVAEIYGTTNGVERAEVFPMSRVAD
jgi:hypothetical protein